MDNIDIVIVPIVGGKFPFIHPWTHNELCRKMNWNNNEKAKYCVSFLNVACSTQFVVGCFVSNVQIFSHDDGICPNGTNIFVPEKKEKTKENCNFDSFTHIYIQYARFTFSSVHELIPSNLCMRSNAFECDGTL